MARHLVRVAARGQDAVAEGAFVVCTQTLARLYQRAIVTRNRALVETVRDLSLQVLLAIGNAREEAEAHVEARFGARPEGDDAPVFCTSCGLDLRHGGEARPWLAFRDGDHPAEGTPLYVTCGDECAESIQVDGPCYLSFVDEQQAAAVLATRRAGASRPA